MSKHVDPEFTPEVVSVLRSVPIETLATAVDLPAELHERVSEMMTLGTRLVDIAEVATVDGWELVVIPLEPDTFLPTHDVEDDDDEVESFPSEVDYPDPDWDGDESLPDDEDEYEDADDYPRQRFGGLLDRLGAMFGKGVSFEQENATIARNRKRAAAREPHAFERAVWATRKGVIRCRVCGGPEPTEGTLCAGVMTKDGHAHGSLGNLTLRQVAYVTALDAIAETLGPWSPYDAHLMNESPFVDDGIACSNCVAYDAEGGYCEWVTGPIPATAICKLWVVPDAIRTDSPVTKEITRRDGEWCVTSADGSRSFGCYATEAEAQARLAQVERFSKAETYTPPKGVREEGKRALEWIADGHAGSGFTAVGRKRASDLAAGRGVSLDTIKRMASYLARHEVDKKGKGWSPGEDGYPSPGRVAWAAWGGDPAVSWTRSILDSVEKGDPTISDVHVDVPYRRRRRVESGLIPGVFTKSDERRYTLGPWYVPDQYDAHGEWTDSDELQTALWDYVRAGDRSIRLQHNVDVTAGEWVEALTWPYPVTVPLFDVEKSTTVEHEFPAGTVFMGVVWEPWAWDLVKQGKIRGYSMGGRGQRVAVDLGTEGTEL